MNGTRAIVRVIRAVAVSVTLSVATVNAQTTRPARPLPGVRATPRPAIGTPASATALLAAAPWTVTLVPRNMPFRVGQCTPISVELLDASGKDKPRAPNGWRVSIADFDMNVSSAPRAALVAQGDGASSWAACACPGVALGTVATITATYPARSINPKSRVPGVAFQSSISLPVGYAPPGTGNPSACAGLPVALNPPPANPTSGHPGPGNPATTGGSTQIPPTVTVAQPQRAASMQPMPGHP